MNEVDVLAKTQLVIFDCDGVLVDSEPFANGLLHHALEPYVGQEAAKFTQNAIGRSFKDIQRSIESTIPGGLPAYFWQDLQSATLAGLPAALKPDPELRKFLKQLSRPFCVASSGSHEKIRTTLAAVNLLDLFDQQIFSAEDVASGKPAPDLFLFAAAHNQTPPDACLVIEDSAPGLAAAAAAKMRSLHFIPDASWTASNQITRLENLVEHL